MALISIHNECCNDMGTYAWISRMLYFKQPLNVYSINKNGKATTADIIFLVYVTILLLDFKTCFGEDQVFNSMFPFS